MKWFKHYTNAHKGKVLQRLYLEFGKPSGYGLYFLFTSYLIDMWDRRGEPEFVIFIPELCAHLGIKRFKLKTFLECFDNIPRTFPEHSENKPVFRSELDKNILKITFPKLSEILHRDAFSSGHRPESVQPKTSVEKSKSKSKSIPTEEQLRWFTELSEKYKATFLNTTIGTKAKQRFAEQIQDEESYQNIQRALANYKAALDYDNRDRAWRSPKKTFETFLGTKSSGFFWQQYLEPPNIPAPHVKVVL